MSEQTSAGAARRDHRRHLGPRAGARPRAARPRRARRLRRAAPRRRRARRPRTAGAPPASSATCRARRTSIRSRSRCSARSAASTCSSTTPRRSARCRSRRWPTPTAKTSSWRWRPTSLGPFRLTKALLGSLAASAREGGGRWWSTCRATPPSRRTPAGAPTAPARRRSIT